MKLLLKQAARIRHNAGEIVEVSPAEANFLLSVGAAVIVTDAKQEQEQNVVNKKQKKGK
jgi:ribosomal protein L9